MFRMHAFFHSYKDGLHSHVSGRMHTSKTLYIFSCSRSDHAWNLPHHSKGLSLECIRKLRSTSIAFFIDFNKYFVRYFIGEQCYKKLTTHLFNVYWESAKSLWNYVNRIKNETLQVKEIDGGGIVAQIPMKFLV